MKLVPPYIIDKKTPNSEKKVFEALLNDENPITKNWVV